MQVSIVTNSQYLNPQMKQHIQERISTVLLRFRYMIKRIEVSIFDKDNDEGKIQMQCSVKISTEHLPDVVIEDKEANEFLAVSRAFARAKRTLTRNLGRWKLKKRNAQPQVN